MKRKLLMAIFGFGLTASCSHSGWNIGGTFDAVTRPGHGNSTPVPAILQDGDSLRMSYDALGFVSVVSRGSNQRDIRWRIRGEHGEKNLSVYQEEWHSRRAGWGKPRHYASGYYSDGAPAFLGKGRITRVIYREETIEVLSIIDFSAFSSGVFKGWEMRGNDVYVSFDVDFSKELLYIQICRLKLRNSA